MTFKQFWAQVFSKNVPVGAMTSWSHMYNVILIIFHLPYPKLIRKKSNARGINHKENTQLTAVNTTELKQEAS